jgi:hypothetical protein
MAVKASGFARHISRKGTKGGAVAEATFTHPNRIGL